MEMAQFTGQNLMKLISRFFPYWLCTVYTKNTSPELINRLSGDEKLVN